jgi:hypothetical protein
MALPIHGVSAAGWRATDVALFKRKSALRSSYDAVAKEYARWFVRAAHTAQLRNTI